MMTRHHILTAITIGIAVNLSNAKLLASDACAPTRISTSANVSVSDGSAYQTRSHYHNPNAAIIEIIRDEPSTFVVEGPYGWSIDKNGATLGDAFTKTFALGHQFHAFILHFHDIVENLLPVEDVTFSDTKLDGVAGDFPFGGEAYLFGDKTNPVGMRFVFPDTPPIDVTLFDWRKTGDRELPYHIRIDDQDRIFDYQYTEIMTADATPLWFFDIVDAPSIDEVKIYRLHRQLLAAHCVGDADMMGALTAPETIMASRGELFQSSHDETRTRFESVFKRVVYTGYHDLTEPVINVSESGDIGWAAVNVRTIGSEMSSGESFDSQWAWIMLVKKIDGVWLNAGNASNIKQN